MNSKATSDRKPARGEGRLILLGMTLLLCALCIVACNQGSEETCDISDDVVLRHVLSCTYEDSGYLVVHPTASVYFGESGEDERLNRRITIKHVAEKLFVEGCDMYGLVQRLLDRNESHPRLPLVSEPEHGFVVDTDSTYERYFARLWLRGRGWKKLYEDHPLVKGIVTVSLPVCDPRCGVVLVYRGTQRHGLGGEGWIIALRVEDTALVELDSILMYIS